MRNKNTFVILITLIYSMLIGGYLLFLISPRFLGANMAPIEDIFYQNSKIPKISAFNESIFIDGNDMFANNASSDVVCYCVIIGRAECKTIEITSCCIVYYDIVIG